MVAVPPTAVIPVTAPLEEFTVAMAVLLLLHVPPPTISLSPVVNPVQTLVTPVIGDSGFTVTNTELGQPVGPVYIIFTVPPDIFTPVTFPEASMVAIAPLVLLQVPPVVASLSDITEPGHTGTEPTMGNGNGFTVTTALVEQMPPPNE